MKKTVKRSVFGVFSVCGLFAIVACSGSDPGTTSSSGGSSSGGSSSGGSSTSSSGASGSTSSSSSSSSSSSGASGSTSSSSSSSSSSSGGSSSGGSSSGGSSGIADAGADTAPFQCGKPGDPGNSIGVGKYCDTLVDCLGNSGATLCATLGDPGAHFCTTTCTQGNNAACGEKATCQCQGTQCGCFPDACK
jgi:hypothetical protein